ncbi:MAG: hypothetical protein LJF04_18520 [Gemmatimonadetes bacterium]|nr:hypothetical protein [Gemmatimonadota bacterium]
MYQPMLYLHWKQIKLVLIPFVIGSFGLPLLTIQGLGTNGGTTVVEPMTALLSAQSWLTMYPLLAAAVGITLALSAWNWDHQLDHVYSLSLPISRRQYAMMKMGAGAALALLPVAALWMGSLVAASVVTLPAGLHAYPNQLALRFLLGVMISYATAFAFAAGTIRTTVIVLSAVLLYFLGGAAAQSYLAVFIPFFQHHDLVGNTFNVLLTTGPFAVFTGSWVLIDV